MNNFICAVFFGGLLLVSSCNEKETNFANSPEAQNITNRTTLELNDYYVLQGLVYPPGTTLDQNGSFIEIQLPQGFYFVVEGENETLTFKSIQCYECQCTEGGIQGCDVVIGGAGFACDHYNPCIKCSGRFVDCDLHNPSNVIGIIDSLDGVRFVDSAEEYEQLSDLQENEYIDSVLIAKLYDTLGLTAIRDQLFTSAYFMLASSDSDTIVVSACRNKIALPVKATWRNYVIGDINNAAYPEVLHDRMVFCDCARGPNPFDLVVGECQLSFEYIVNYLRCKNWSCQNGCRMTIISNY